MCLGPAKMKRGREGDFYGKGVHQLWVTASSPQGGCYHMLFSYGKIKGTAAYLITPKDNYSKEQKLRE